MARRTIQSPGVEVRESDLSLRTVSQGTTTYIAGFANNGPTDEVVGISNITDFEQVYGAPRTPAERYFYHSVRAALNSTGSVLVNRLPYGSNNGQGFGSKITVLAYPTSGISNNAGTKNMSLSGTWLLGQPRQFEMTQEDYLQLKNGELFTTGWSQTAGRAETWETLSDLNDAAVLIVNKGQTVIDGTFNGYYIGLADNTNINPASAFDAIQSVQTVTQSANRPVTPQEFTSVEYTYNGGIGTGANFNITKTGTSYTVSIAESGADYQAGETFVIGGSALGGDNITNDLTITIDSTAPATSAINTISSSGTGALGDASTFGYTEIPQTRFEFALTATPEFGDNPAVGSISQVMEDRITGYDTGTNEFNDTLNIGVFKLKQSVFSKDANRLDYLLEEGYNGSIGYYRQVNSENGGAPVNFFLENVENDSRNIDILVNPYLSDQIDGIKLDSSGNPLKRIRIVSKTLEDNLYLNLNTPLSSLSADSSYATVQTLSAQAGVTYAQLTGIQAEIDYGDSLFPLGGYGETKLNLKEIGSVPQKLDRALTRIRNAEKFNIDIICEAGLGTIFTYMQTAGSLSADGFDDTRTTDAIEDLRTSNDLSETDAGEDARTAYTTIFNKFATFCGPVKDGGRGDVLFVADPLRQILVSGKNNKVQQDKTKNFYTDIYWAMRHQFELANTSYATVFANWMLVYDNYSGLYVYVPSSGYASAKMASTDAAVGPWGAPAGFNRGIITDAADIALSPNQRQRDDLYTANLNPIATFQDRGNIFFGQKTLLRKPSAFDRINVRRTFLYLEKITKRTMEFFLFENNTLFTRTRVVNTLTPFFERVKADNGLYDFLIVCDERNNTPEVIDQNELVVDIYLKPVRTAEFILVNFYATRTDTNFEELIGG